MRPIPDEMKARFRLLLQAAQDERLFIANCPELGTGRPAYLVCEALPIPGTDQVDLLPVAEMIGVFPWDKYGWPGPEELAMTVRLADLRRVQP
ncbi:MAG: hypothetical protein CVU63_08605 [Deltaproteobacteria bacterium HGW-Deltaproteobacteria-20]|jgi:hypothetical protein|nr:MAG: hypothetical protein CVU63_08605 [Deltaproteobacteria bacterium HGW-Deltaproteobacteria-20]